MRYRFPLFRKGYLKLLRVPLILGSIGFATWFFFDDQSFQSLPVNAEEEALADTNQATLANQPSSSQLGSNQPGLIKPPKPSALIDIAASGFKPHWKNVSLDQGQVHLHILGNSLHLKQARHQLGSEAFEYASFLFGQIAQEMKKMDTKSSAVSEEFCLLSLQTQSMGDLLRRLGEIRYDGLPTQDMTPLRVHENLKTTLNSILIQSSRLEPQAGPTLKRFINTVNHICQNPQMARYPETLKLLNQESQLLQQLATHLTLHWENNLDALSQKYTPVITDVHVYVQQTLPLNMDLAIIY